MPPSPFSDPGEGAATPVYQGEGAAHARRWSQQQTVRMPHPNQFGRGFWIFLTFSPQTFIY